MTKLKKVLIQYYHAGFATFNRTYELSSLHLSNTKYGSDWPKKSFLSNFLPENFNVTTS